MDSHWRTLAPQAIHAGLSANRMCRSSSLGSLIITRIAWFVRQNERDRAMVDKDPPIDFEEVVVGT